MANNLEGIFMLSSLLLRYPDQTIIDSLPELYQIATTLQRNFKEQFVEFLDYYKSHDLIYLQEEYVKTFDFNEENSLYLTQRTKGANPERGQELLKIKAAYQSAGLSLDSSELPDFLPVFLEFLSKAPAEAVKEILREYIVAITSLHRNLELIGSPYQLVVKNCLSACESLLKGG